MFSKDSHHNYFYVCTRVRIISRLSNPREFFARSLCENLS